MFLLSRLLNPSRTLNVDVINVSGHRLSTAEIESSLITHRGVAETAVIGTSDELTGQAVYAVRLTLCSPFSLPSSPPANQVVSSALSSSTSIFSFHHGSSPSPPIFRYEHNTNAARRPSSSSRSSPNSTLTPPKKMPSSKNSSSLSARTLDLSPLPNASTSFRISPRRGVERSCGGSCAR
jgi:AMP-binding enzyme C-terminal domain